MAQYRVVLFDRSTSTEYEKLVDATDPADAITKATTSIHASICEAEEATDPAMVQSILDDLEPRVSQAL